MLKLQTHTKFFVVWCCNKIGIYILNLPYIYIYIHNINVKTEQNILNIQDRKFKVKLVSYISQPNQN